MKLLDLKYGCDPEFFCVNKDGNVLSPALLEREYGLIPIFEDLKHPIYSVAKDFHWMQDGVAFEVTILHPCNSMKEMYGILNDALENLEGLISSVDSNLSLYKKPVVNIVPEMYLPMLGDEKIYQGFIFGCDPDRDAILPDYECKTLDVKTHTLRYGGGHKHVSGIKELEFFIPAVKLMAITLGNFSIANTPYPELEKLRALTYGRPGRYRVQNYKDGSSGIEYRTPSNSWVDLPLDKYVESEYWTQVAMNFLIDERTDVIDNYLPDTINAIQNADVELSQDILSIIQKEIR